MDTTLVAKMIPTLIAKIAAATTYATTVEAEAFANRLALIADEAQAAEIAALVEGMWASNRA